MSVWVARLLLTLALQTPWAVGAASAAAMSSGDLLLTGRHGGDGSAWGRTNCASCHFLGRLHTQAPRIRTIVRAKGFATCAGCHGNNGANLSRPCLICHNSQDLPAAPRQGGRHKHDFKVGKSRALGDRQCLSCHLKPDMDGAFELNVDLTPLKDHQGRLTPYENVSDFCLRCHNRDHQPRGVNIQPRPEYGLNDPLTAMEDNYTYLDRHGLINGPRGPYDGLRESRYRYGQTVACTDCHAMHGTRNEKLILDDSRKGVTGLKPAFRQRPFRVRVRHGNAAQLCVLCHSMDDPSIEQGMQDTGNGLAGVHDVTSNCSECHTHGEPVKGGL
jgi:nitrate/TMAO reductase-like tetraheme cytochrome c subunit